jgi:hypothetical protein
VIVILGTMKVDRSMPAGMALFLRAQVAYIKKQQQIMEEMAIQNISRCLFCAKGLLSSVWGMRSGFRVWGMGFRRLAGLKS